MIIHLFFINHQYYHKFLCQINLSNFDLINTFFYSWDGQHGYVLMYRFQLLLLQDKNLMIRIYVNGPYNIDKAS